LLQTLKEQPPWSELPVTILTSGRKSRIEQLLDKTAEAAGSITALERPIAGATLLRSVKAALNSRRRQYLVRDLLEQQQRDKQQLHESEERVRQQFSELEAIYRTAPMGLAVLDCELRYLRINEQLTKIDGISREEHLGRKLTEVVPSLAEQAKQVLQRVIETGLPVRFEFRGETPGQPGVKRIWDERWYPLWDSAGQIVRVGVVAEEITERKRIEAELERARHELQEHAATLEKTVTQRTAKLQEMIGELKHVSHAIVHDMRAPLRAMRAFADILSMEGPAQSPEQRREYMRRITVGAKRMDDLIQDVLTYNYALLRESPLQPVPLLPLLRGLVDDYPNLSPLLADIRIEDHLPTVLGNEALLTQCFSNLLANAVKFVPPGVRPQVKVWAEVREHVARIWIEDNGIGIPLMAQKRLFRLFQRLTAEYEGTGVGLAIVRKVVERMDGKVGVESQEGQGSRFWVELRIADPIANAVNAK
jgi:PAS domain S-box-containing protein